MPVLKKKTKQMQSARFLIPGFAVKLDYTGKIVMILTMLTGRVGSITLMMSLVVRNKKRSKNKILPEEDILIG